MRFRPYGKNTDGCYSITVEISRYRKIATPVHDPIQNQDYENYSHTEIRELEDGEDINIEPPKGRKKRNKTRQSLRLDYRHNILNNLKIELDAFQ